MKAFVIVDLQNDFLPGGALAVPQGNEIIPVINSLIPLFSLTVATQDLHPSDHVSFAVNHPHKKVGDVIDVDGIEQILWPVHCVRNTKGAELVRTLDKAQIHSYFFKGTEKETDSYSAFFDNQKKQSTGLAEFLRSHGVTDVYFAGLALDYCVAYSAFDAIDLGFNVFVIVDACRAINVHPHDADLALEAIAAKGGRIITSKEIL